MMIKKYKKSKYDANGAAGGSNIIKDPFIYKEEVNYINFNPD